MITDEYKKILPQLDLKQNFEETANLINSVAMRLESNEDKLAYLKALEHYITFYKNMIKKQLLIKVQNLYYLTFLKNGDLS